MRYGFRPMSNSRARAVAFLAFAAVGLRADVCVWRDPERTMALVFPKAMDYQSLTRKIPPELRLRIEARLGVSLDPSEREEWGSYRVLGPGSRELGRIIACAQTGEYGAIEVVMGVAPDGKVVGLYVQRSRERVNSALKSREFLRQFEGKTLKDPLHVDKDIRGIPSGEKAVEAVTLAVRKMLLLYSELK